MYDATSKYLVQLIVTLANVSLILLSSFAPHRNGAIFYEEGFASITPYRDSIVAIFILYIILSFFIQIFLNFKNAKSRGFWMLLSVIHFTFNLFFSVFTLYIYAGE